MNYSQRLNLKKKMRDGEIYRKMKRAEDWAERESEEGSLLSLSPNKKVFITVVLRFPLSCLRGQ